jgi:hypothetical protein
MRKEGADTETDTKTDTRLEKRARMNTILKPLLSLLNEHSKLQGIEIKENVIYDVNPSDRNFHHTVPSYNKLLSHHVSQS